ncbi:hypothetical protein TYRP_014811 [Tyrophagus putrescentiae]|nr:hypothetical protein TYRP_014811 [Tyrophagus putrescentiae]
MERCLENGMRRKKKKNSFREDNNPADKDSDEDSEAEVSNSTRRRHSVMSSLANSSSSPGSTSPAASETAANEDHLQKDAEQMYETADRFIELQLTSQLSSVNIASDPQEPATQKMHLSSSTKSSKSLRRQSRSSADLLALNYFEQKEIDDLAKAYDTAFGNEKTAKVIHKPKTSSGTDFTAQMLFQPREGIVGEGCGGLLGNSEFMRYHFTYYSKLLQRYLESKYRSEEKAERKYADLEGHRTHTMDIIKNNRKKILDQFEGKIELPEIIQELYDLT